MSNSRGRSSQSPNDDGIAGTQDMQTPGRTNRRRTRSDASLDDLNEGDGSSLPAALGLAPRKRPYVPFSYSFRAFKLMTGYGFHVGAELIP